MAELRPTPHRWRRIDPCVRWCARCGTLHHEETASRYQVPAPRRAKTVRWAEPPCTRDLARELRRLARGFRRQHDNGHDTPCNCQLCARAEELTGGGS